jgi:hypothetical protein
MALSTRGARDREGDGAVMTGAAEATGLHFFVGERQWRLREHGGVTGLAAERRVTAMRK